MKLFLLLPLCVFAFNGNLNAQKLNKIEKFVIYPPFNNFFEKHTGIKEIRFNKNRNSKSLKLEIIEKDIPLFEGLNSYDFDNAGDRYFFEKQFGLFRLPDSLYLNWIDKKADDVKIEGRIRKDSVFMKIIQTYYTNETDKIFKKVKVRVDYQKGMHFLAQELSDSLYYEKVEAIDSVVILKGAIERDGKMIIMNIATGNSNSRYIKALVKRLNASGPWIPYETGGRKVRTYKKLYVRLNPDGTYRIAMQ